MLFRRESVIPILILLCVALAAFVVFLAARLRSASAHIAELRDQRDRDVETIAKARQEALRMSSTDDELQRVQTALSDAQSALATVRAERDAAIRELRRGYALTDDPQKRQEILERLQSLVAAGEREEVEDDLKVIEGEWRESYPFLSRGEYLMLGPTVDPMKCAGTSAAASKECARDWSTRLAK